MKAKVLNKATFLFFVLGLLIVSAGCSDFQPQGDTPPLPLVSVGDERLEVVRASYCWKGGCVDYAGPPEMLEGKEPFQIQKGEKVKVVFDDGPKPSSISVSRLLRSEQEWEKDEFDDQVITVPNEEGVYYYDLLARWSSKDGQYLGDSYYAFVVEVK